MDKLFRMLRLSLSPHYCFQNVTQHTSCRRMLCQSAETFVKTQVVGRVCIISINRVENRNCLHGAAIKALTDVFRKFNSDDDLYAAVMHGEGGNFCAGIEEDENEHSHDINMDLHNLVFSKPVLAAISGYAVAGGLELALKCDLRILDESAIMGTSRTFGLPLFDNGASRLPKLIGVSHAFDIVTTGRPITAAEAFRFGLANRVVPTGAALGEAVKIAQSIGGRDQVTMLKERASVLKAVYQNT